MAEPTAGQPAGLDAVVRGWVQGVGFRYFVLDRAAALGLVGWVANELDGSVRCVAEGPRTDLETLLAVLAEGPLGARVDDVRVTWGPARGTYERFTIRAGGHSGD
jgi:acylphosphatase